MKLKNNFYPVLGLIIGGVALALFLFWLIYNQFEQKFSSTEIVYNRIDSVIGLLGLVLSIITVISIFVSYQFQIQQIKANNQEVEFNRLLDIVYRQLEFTNESISNDLSVSFNELLEDVELIYDTIEKDQLVIYLKCENSIEYLNSINLKVNFFNDLFNNSFLNEERVFLLKKIVISNFKNGMLEKVLKIRKVIENDKGEYPVFRNATNDKLYREFRLIVFDLTNGFLNTV